VNSLSVTEARSNLYKLIDSLATSGEPVFISGKRNNAVLLSEDDWRSINETLYLLSIPKMRETIVDGMNASVEDFDEEIDW